MEKKRLQYIDLARGFAILAIVYSHFTNQVSVVKPDLATCFGICFLSQFHISLFFIVRGQILAYQENFYKKNYILKRCKALLIPYFVFSILNILYLIIDMRWEDPTKTIIEVQRNLIHAFTLYGISVLWFLPAMLFGEIWFLFILKRISKKIVPYFMIFFMTVICMVAPFLSVKEADCIWMRSIQILILNYILVVLLRSFVALFYIWIGFYSAGFFKKIYGDKTKIKDYAILFTGVGSVLFLFSSTVEVHYLDMGKGWISILCGLCLSFGILFLFMLLEEKDVGWLHYPGICSLWIMCTHKDFGIPGWCVFFAEIAASLSPRGKKYVFWFTAVAVLFVIEYAICMIIQKTRTFLFAKKEIQ
ncbi:MAG: acyltransferase [Lachnospiraceae bacterium]|nr:acyltransferase [Lachnospiraceae bacterium]